MSFWALAEDRLALVDAGQHAEIAPASITGFCSSRGHRAVSTRDALLIQSTAASATIPLSVAFMGWYPFNADCLVTVDRKGVIRSHLVAAASVSTETVHRVQIAEFACVVDACFCPAACDPWGPFSMYILLDNADVVCVCPLLVTPAAVPVELLPEGGCKWLLELRQRIREVTPDAVALIDRLPRFGASLATQFACVRPEPAASAASVSRIAHCTMSVDEQAVDVLLVLFADGRMDVTCSLDAVRPRWSLSASPPVLFDLCLMHSVRFPSLVTHICTLGDQFWVRTQDGCIRRCRITEDAVDSAVVCRDAKTLLLDGEWLFVDVRRRLPVYERSPEAIALPAVNALWPPAALPPIPPSVASLPALPALHAAFPDELDIDAVVAFSDTVSTWRKKSLLPLIAHAEAWNGRARHLLAFIQRLSWLRDKLAGQLEETVLPALQADAQLLSDEVGPRNGAIRTRMDRADGTGDVRTRLAVQRTRIELLKETLTALDLNAQ